MRGNENLHLYLLFHYRVMDDGSLARDSVSCGRDTVLLWFLSQSDQISNYLRNMSWNIIISYIYSYMRVEFHTHSVWKWEQLLLLHLASLQRYSLKYQVYISNFTLKPLTTFRSSHTQPSITHRTTDTLHVPWDFRSVNSSVPQLSINTLSVPHHKCASMQLQE